MKTITKVNAITHTYTIISEPASAVIKQETPYSKVTHDIFNGTYKNRFRALTYLFGEKCKLISELELALEKIANGDCVPWDEARKALDLRKQREKEMHYGR
jgi:hypothetical protein